MQERASQARLSVHKSQAQAQAQAQVSWSWKRIARANADPKPVSRRLALKEAVLSLSRRCSKEY